jgi:MYXO-CTERM domain-containing protein
VDHLLVAFEGSISMPTMAKRTISMFSTISTLLSAGFLSVGVAACAADPGEPAPVATIQAPILGGTKANVGQYPTVVALLVNAKSGGQGLCTGTLIAPTVVLTAAHCVSPEELGWSSEAEVAQNSVVFVDSMVLQQGGGQQIQVAKTIAHPSFSQPGDPDLGIVKLKTPVTDRKPSPLNLDATKAPAGIEVTMVGFGVSNTATQSAGTEFVLTNKKSVACSTFGAGIGAIPDDTFICYDQRNGSGKCSGDSGGPSFAMIDGVQTLVGVTSFGDQGCTQMGADMRVDAGKQFILSNAPEAFCQQDGTCDESCGVGSLPADPDCQTCEGNGDCASTHVCDHGYCVPGPTVPGGEGAPCETEADCSGGQLCGELSGEKRCTSRCESADDCADGFECAAGGACWPSQDTQNPEDGDGGGCGCTVGGARSGAGAAGGAFAMLMLVGAALVRHRRRA